MRSCLCLTLIVYEIVPLLPLIADEIVPSGLALIVYDILSVLKLIADEIVSVFGIDSL